MLGNVLNCLEFAMPKYCCGKILYSYIQQDAYHRRKHESRIRTSTALIPREINMRELKHNIPLDIKYGFLMHLTHGISHKQLIFLLE